MKQISLIEMDGFLKGKCIPRDLKVNETNAEYLVRKFGELEARCAALAAENAALKDSVEHAAGCIAAAEAEGLIDALAEKDGERLADLIHRRLCHSHLPVETPATDAFLAEVRAHGVEMLAKNHQSIVNALKGDSLFSDGEYRHAAIVSAAVYFAAELRKGGNQ
ncbi:TPA: ead/Ea22-like family protein [Escherichia coli]|uniref:ead/Ea22-like family protein n=1 Tax=Escherichia coli TaxID=562 RepID=UPI0010CC84C3|nr:ead/Ea22-like family protein [Escherichia coli]EFE8059341.1 ead/Ea22-like family protein [Escherichia coli]MBS8483637.1 ead/Ea22-like family protein [Escherichia coli]MBS9232394.1 ead/Ea22-like family protein [Escherichia coli]MQQ98489.1 ead/Ea22-like family protein [Escherichia coli]GDA98931.1 hypothetical protein HmCmsJML133_00154 [Escherichia coli]